MRQAKIEIVKEEIVEFFEGLEKRVYSLPEIYGHFYDQRKTWGLPKSTTFKSFCEFFGEEGKLGIYRFPFIFCPITLVYWEEPTIEEIAMAIRPKGYLSHSSAMHHHGLVEQSPIEVVYVNDEQSPKPRGSGKLEQSRIDAAFKRLGRISNNKVTIQELTFCLLSGMHTNMLGVTTEVMPEIPVPVRVTDLERTLIDIVVRPIYAGGAADILEAYRNAAGKLDIGKMATYLGQLQYIYPYHQAIGFLLDYSDKYSSSAADVFRRLPIENDFYLDYGILETSYNEDWRIFYPAKL